MSLSHVADDFAAIARRMKEIAAEDLRAERAAQREDREDDRGWIISGPAAARARGAESASRGGMRHASYPR